MAKIASDLRKPDGLVVVEPGQEPAFLAPLAISRLWGIGERTAAALRQYGIVTLGDLQRTPEDLLVRGMGPHAATLASPRPGHRRRAGLGRRARRSRSATSTRSTSTRATPT